MSQQLDNSQDENLINFISIKYASSQSGQEHYIVNALKWNAVSRGMRQPRPLVY